MDLLLYLALIPALGLAAQWLAWRTHLPSILLLLVFGVLLGVFVKPDNYLTELTGSATAGPQILFPLVSLSVAVILLEGGLSLRLGELRESGGAVLRLCTIGAVITLVGSMVAAHFVLGFQWRLSCLLGAVLVVTGPTVIGPLLRQVRPHRRVATTLKWEGIVIDPIGAVLAVLVFEHLLEQGVDLNLTSAILMLTKTVAVGTILGVAGGSWLTYLFRRFLVPDNLHGVATLAMALLLFAISDHFAHESGLITMTVLGIWLANQRHFDIEHIIEFKEHLRTLLIGCLFIVLGSRVDLNGLIVVGWSGLLFLALLIVVVRPLSVFVSLYRSALEIRERAFIASLAPRGIVAAAISSVFVLEMESRGAAFDVPGADQFATVTFLVIVGTVAVYGVAASPLAKWLRLAHEITNGVLIAGADSWVRDFALELNSAGIPVLVVDTNFNKISTARVAGLEAICANILNEHVQKDLPLSGIGCLMAMTPNDEVNSLAIRECRTLFDRSGLYQLAFDVANTHHRRGMTKNLMGRELFGSDMTFLAIRDLHQLGATFKATTLSDTFTYQDFIHRYNGGAKLLCVVDEDHSLAVNTSDVPLQPIAGQTIITLVPSITVPDDHAAVTGPHEST